MTLTITRLGHHGDGIAEGPVFVPRTLPGEVVEGEIAQGRMAAPRILTPSPERVAAPCPHYKACGGCALQHAREGFVTDWKEGVIRQALAAQGLDAPFHAPHISGLHTRRRATFSGRRLKKGALVGFHARASDTVASVPDCLILRPELTAALPLLEELVMMAGSRKGEMALSLTLSDVGLDLSVTGGKPLDGPLQATLGQWAGANGLARLAWDGEVDCPSSAAAANLRSRKGRPAAGGVFLQATPDAQAALQWAVAKAVGDAPRVADLFCRLWHLCFALGRTGRGSCRRKAWPKMLTALDHGWRHATGLKRVTHETRDLVPQPAFCPKTLRALTPS